MLEVSQLANLFSIGFKIIENLALVALRRVSNTCVLNFGLDDPKSPTWPHFFLSFALALLRPPFVLHNRSLYKEKAAVVLWCCGVRNACTLRKRASMSPVVQVALKYTKIDKKQVDFFTGGCEFVHFFLFVFVVDFEIVNLNFSFVLLGSSRWAVYFVYEYVSMCWRSCLLAWKFQGLQHRGYGRHSSARRCIKPGSR